MHTNRENPEKAESKQTITERKKAEEALRESERRLNRSQEIAHLGSWELDLQSNQLTWSDEVYRIFGLKPQQFGATYEAFLKAVHPDDRATVDAAYSSSVREGKNGYEIEHRVVRPDGEVRIVHEKCDNIRDESGKIVRSIGMVQDITERKKTEEALRESEERLEFHAENTPLAVIEWDSHFDVTRWADDAEKMLGWNASETIGKRIMDLHMIYEPDIPIVEKTMSKLTSGEIKVVSSNRNITKDGRLIYCTWYSSVLLDVTGKMVSVFSFVEDYTAKVKAEEALEENNKNLEKLVEERTRKLELSSLYARNLIEASLDPLVTISAEGKITDVNIATEQVTGTSREELIGSDFSDYFTEPEKAKIGYKIVFSEGFITDYPLAIKHKSGKVTEVLYNATVYRNAAGEIQGVFAAARDITERKKAEEQAQESAKKLKDFERLAAIGATAGMVGHDIRNPLQAIVGDLYLLEDEVNNIPDGNSKQSATETINSIAENIEYINKIVQDLQDYARPINPKIENTEIEPIIEKLLTKKSVPTNVNTTVIVEDEAKKIQADSYYLNRILYNLVTNAIQAMPKGGKLTIHALKEANDVVITIKDTGIGIPKEIQDKMFTLMFTTKAKGQGFGLPVVKRMIESLGGTVSFESQADKGTTFTVRLPPPRS